MTFAWPTRLKYGLLAALAGWLAGWLVTIPFELTLAWRYVDAHTRQLPDTVAKGLVVWAAFSLFMAMAGFVPVVLPLFLFVSPRWIVRWRRFLIPGVMVLAVLAIDRRMGLLNSYHFRHPEALFTFFFSAPNMFYVTFALVLMWVYAALAKQRLNLATREE